MNRIVRKIAIILLVAVGVCIGLPKAASAADNTVKVYIGDSTTARHHRAMALGTTSDTFSFSIASGTVSSSSFASSNESAFKIVNQQNGTCQVQTVAEGTGYVNLTVQTTSGTTLSEKVFISVYTKQKEVAGKAKQEAAVYRGATDNANAENNDQKGTLLSGKEFSVIAVCEEYYLVRMEDDTVFEDGLNTGFLKKSDVIIPVTSVSIPNTDGGIELKIGDSRELSAETLPELANQKNITWKSSKSTVASVNASGKVSAKTAGTATITAEETYSGKTAQVKVTVSEIYAESVTIDDRKMNETFILSVGNERTVTATVLPANTTKKNLVWSSSNTDILQVDKTGKIKAMRAGECTLTVRDTFSGKSDSVRILTAHALDRNSLSTPEKLKVDKCTDFKDNHLSWNTIKGASYYRVYMWSAKSGNNSKFKVRKPKYKKVKKTSFNDKKVKKGNKYKYVVKAYSKEGKMLKKSAAVTITATAPELNVQIKRGRSLTLDWEQVPLKELQGIKGYCLYRKEKGEKKFKRIATIKGKKNYTYDDNNLKDGTVYQYKVCAYQTKKKKKILGAYSNTVEEKTINTGANIAYFTGDSTKYDGVKVSDEFCTEKESTDIMNHYKIEGIVHSSPFLKYHMTKDTLYIHLYVEFCSYSRENGTYTEVPEMAATFSGRRAGTAGSYQQIFTEGVKMVYDTVAKGNNSEEIGDFNEDVAFAVKMIVHNKEDSETEGYEQGQDFLKVTIGGNCKGCNTATGESWYHAHPVVGNSVLNENNTLHMPENKNLNRKGVAQLMFTVGQYKATSGHELSHILGLDDAYTEKDTKIDRMAENEETCVKDGRYWHNIMLDSSGCPLAKSNDIEMILTAYDKSVKQEKKTVRQSYNQYVDTEGEERNFSDAIKNRDDGKVLIP